MTYQPIKQEDISHCWPPMVGVVPIIAGFLREDFKNGANPTIQGGKFSQFVKST